MLIELRAGLPGDFEFARQTYYDTMRWIIERLFGWDEAREAANFAKHFDISGVQIVVVDGRDAGWLQTRSTEETTTLLSLFVAPALQRQGVGTTVLNRLLAEAEGQNKAVILGVVQFNPAIHLYERHGFQITHQDEHKFYMRREPRGKVEYMSLATQSAVAELLCFNPSCRERYAVTDVLYNCPKCGALIETAYAGSREEPADLRRLFRDRRTSNAPLDQSGVWRYRELIPFLADYAHVVTLREGNTPLLGAPLAAEYGGLKSIAFKHQGFNPTGSFKDNGMTCGVAQARRLGMRRVACVSTGNTSASMAAYAASAGIEALIFLPHGNISFGKLAQALEYGAKTLQVEANFDEILALIRILAERLGIYLLNSMNPFRIEGQKTIMFEMLDQRDWRVPDWVVLPGGNLGNVSAFGKGLREALAAGLIDRLPRLALIQAEGSAPFYDFVKNGARDFHPVAKPETLATAIRIGDPVSWPKALHEIRSSNGVVEKVSEQEIADAKAIIGRCGIGCEPASAATLAGIRKLTASGAIDRDADVVAVLTGNVLKDPDYIYRYHTGTLEAPGGVKIQSTYGNQSVVVPNDADRIAEMLK